MVFDAGLRVHRNLGPGLLESAYDLVKFLMVTQHYRKNIFNTQTQCNL